jgi:drug/metabolite transporter (DMT)-like permease
MAIRRFFAYAAIYILWGGSFLAIRRLVAVAPPFFSAGVRFLVAGLVIYAYGRAQGAPTPARRQWINTALLGLVMFLGNYSCLFWSSKFLPSGLASVLTSMIPVWIVLEELLVFRSASISVKGWLGIGLGIVGAALIALPSGVQAAGMTKPALILLLGTLFWSSGTVWTTRMDLPKNPAISAGLQMAWGGCFLLLLSGNSGELAQVATLSQRWNWQASISLAYLIIAGSVIAFTAYVWLIGREPAARVASFAYVNPLVALALGFGLAHERPTFLQYIGTVLVLAGVFSTLTGKALRAGTPVETAV